MKFYICLWGGERLPRIPWFHGQEIDDLGLGLKHGVAISHRALELGYNVMIRKLRNGSGNYLISIDKGSFECLTVPKGGYTPTDNGGDNSVPPGNE